MPAPTLADRSLFPDLAAAAYLNHAAISPPSTRVLEAVARITSDYARRGLGALMDAFAVRDHLRGQLADLIHVPAHTIGFVPSTTRGLCDIALAINWRPGERIIVFTGEFPANVTPWQQVARSRGLELVFVSLDGFAHHPEQGLRDLEAELLGTRLVAVSMVQFQTGLKMPLRQMAELCHSYGAELAVDAIQGLGAVPLHASDTGIDYLSCGSHKWLMGFEGLGFVYIRPDRMPGLTPQTAGWLSHEQPLGFLLEAKPGLLRYDRPLRRQADFTEGSALNLLGVAALDASLGCIRELGVDSIFSHIQDYHDHLEPELLARGFRSLRATQVAGRSGTLSVQPPSGLDLRALHQALDRGGISCSTPDGVLRFAPHWPNDRQREIPAILAALDGFLSAGVFAGGGDIEDELEAACAVEAESKTDATDPQTPNLHAPTGARVSEELATRLGLPLHGPEFVVAHPQTEPHRSAWDLAPRPVRPDLESRVRHTLAYAILAPSVCNSQPWQWTVELAPPGEKDPSQATVVLSPRTLPHPIHDPDGRFVTISLGAALAGFDLAADNLGLVSTRVPKPAPAVAARRLELAPPDAPLSAGERHWMFQCMTKRRTHRGILAARPPTARLLARLDSVAQAAGCSLHLLHGSARTLVAATIAEGLARLEVDPKRNDEMAAWTFPAESSQAYGTPQQVGGDTFAHDPGDGKLRPARTRDEILAGSPVLAVVATPTDGREAWLAAGQCLMYLQLRGRVDHLWMSPLNAPLHNPALRERLAAIVGATPQLVLRIGHGGDTAKAPRIAVDEVTNIRRVDS